MAKLANAKMAKLTISKMTKLANTIMAKLANCKQANDLLLKLKLYGPTQIRKIA